MRMHCSFFIATLAVAAVGCAKPIPIDRMSVLAPGRAMRLALHYEIQTEGVGGVEESSFSISKTGEHTTVTKREETPYASVDWAYMELPLSVTAMLASNSLRVTMTVQRGRSGHSSAPKGQKKREKSYSFEAGAPGQSAFGLESHLRVGDTEFVAVIDPQGRLASTDVTGKYWTVRKKELANAVRQGAPQEQADLALRWETIGVFPALEDAMAYLPPKDVQAGQSWKVRRERVLPYYAYGFYMLTHGGVYSKEKATCTVQSVNARGRHSVATITIRGKRFPDGPASGIPQRVKHFDLKGQLEVNLNTGAIEKLRLESVPIWVPSKEEDLGSRFKAKFVQVIKLKPT